MVVGNHEKGILLKDKRCLLGLVQTLDTILGPCFRIHCTATVHCLGQCLGVHSLLEGSVQAWSCLQSVIAGPAKAVPNLAPSLRNQKWPLGGYG